MIKVLVVDDEKHILELLSYNLATNGYEVVTATDGFTAIEKVKVEEPDLVLLDVMMPKMDGLQVCRYLRTNLNYWKPIIMISGKGEVTDKILGLEVGANDYVAKTFSTNEIAARVKANLRMFHKELVTQTGFDQGKQEAEFSNSFDFDQQENTVSSDEHVMELTPKEFALFKVLTKNLGKAVKREYLLNYVWGEALQDDTRTLDVHIRYLRQKLGKNIGFEIKTVRGYGYRLEQV